jgi:tetratricopeptide (TPR) repeat protein
VTALLHERDYDAALSALDQRWRTDPLRSDLGTVLTAPSTSSEGHRLRALAYWTEAKAESAAAEMELAVRNGPWNERAHIGLVTMLARMGATDRADDVLQKARAQFPASAALAWTQAAFYAALGRDHEYLPALEATLQAQPLRGVVSMWSALGRFQLRGFNLDAAERAFRRTVSLAPNDPQGHLDLAEFLRSQGRAADALVEYVAVLLLEPDRLAAHIGIGQLHLEAGRDGDAVRVMEYAVSRSPDLPEPRYALATALLRIGRVEDGKRELDAFRQLQAKAMARGRRAYQVATLNLEARLREAEGRYQEALALRQQVIALEPDDVGHRVSIADTLIHLRQFAEAANQLERAAALGAPADIYLQLSQLYARLGLADKSTAVLKRYEAEGQSLRRQQGLNP